MPRSFTPNMQGRNQKPDRNLLFTDYCPLPTDYFQPKTINPQLELMGQYPEPETSNHPLKSMTFIIEYNFL